MMEFWQLCLLLLAVFFAGMGFDRLMLWLDKRQTPDKAHLARICELRNREKMLEDSIRDKQREAKGIYTITAAEEREFFRQLDADREHHPENDPGLK